MLAQLRTLEAARPFPLRGFDCDNGGEFLNWPLVRHFQARSPPVPCTRSRPYKKDDNAHIAQTHWPPVRQWLGSQRFDAPRLVARLNTRYTTAWRLFHNFCLPSVKLLDKRRVRAKIVQVPDDPRTPDQRVLASPPVAQAVKEPRTQPVQHRNPCQLRHAIDAKIRRIRPLAR